MSYTYDVLLKNGMVVDPVSEREGIMDIGISEGKIVETAPEISPSKAEESFDVQGYYVVPGLIDLHMHASSWLGGKFGHKMLAQAGVTSALDMSGPIDSVVNIARDYGVGLNIACVQYVRPGHTVKDVNPGTEEIQGLLEDCLHKGAMGLKLLGGHYPLTPEATARAIEVVNQHKAYIAFHAGSLEQGSDIEGFLEAVTLADGNSLHMAHINSYCRGQVRPCLDETKEAINALGENPNIRSESYLSPFNGTSAKCSDGVPESNVTKKCLITGGFAPTEPGLKEAIMAGWGHINMEAGGKMILAVGQDALTYWEQKNTDTTVSFKVNPSEPRINLATARKESGEFAVDCISTDGGGIPRNVMIEMGLALVKLEALTMHDFVRKASCNPAKILGLRNKGHFKLGADADITILDLDKQKAFMSMANGKVIMHNGYVCGQGSHIITTALGESYVKENGLDPIIVDIEKSSFYPKI